MSKSKEIIGLSNTSYDQAEREIVNADLGEYAPAVKKKPNRRKPLSSKQVSIAPLKDYEATPDTTRKICLVAEKISAGESRQSIQKWIMDTFGVGDRQARAYYGAGMNLLIPDEKEFDDYKRGLLMANMDRLEKIIEKSIESNDAQMLRVAKDCISEINKMIGVSSSNNVTIAKNGDEEIIQITFEK